MEFTLEECIAVREAIALLPKENLRTAVILRYGIDGGKALSQGEIGAILDVTESRVGGMLKEANHRMWWYLSRVSPVEDREWRP